MIRRFYPVCIHAILVFVICAGLGGCEGRDSSSPQTFPQKPIKLIVPFGAGGGSDTFARILQQAIEDQNLLEQPLVVINVPGAGGTIGSRRVKNARPDGYTILLLHEGIMTSQSAGLSTYGPEAFAPVIGTGKTGMVICVSATSPYDSLPQLIEEAIANPGTLLFSCNLGSPSHFAGLMIEGAAPGAEFRFVQSGGGAKRFAGLQGGHADVTALSLAEYMQFKSSGLKAIALLDRERDAAAAEVLTATEQGFDIITSNMQFWWAPKGTSSEKCEHLANVIQRAMQTPQVIERLSQLHISPLVLRGAALQTDLTDRSQRIARVSQRKSIDLPNVPAWTLAAIGVLSGLVGLQAFKYRSQYPHPTLSSKEKSPQPEWLRTGAVVATTCLYILAMQFQIISFPWATVLFVICVGLLLSRPNVKTVTGLCGLALTLGLGLHQLFTRVFLIDLL